MMRFGVGAIAAVLVLTLAGCTEPPAPVAPSPDPSHGPAAAIELTADGFTVLDADGLVVEGVVMEDDPAVALEVLEEVLGVEPVVDEVTSDNACITGTSYMFDDGIQVFAYDPPREALPQTEVLIHSGSAGGLELRADAGFQVGDASEELVADLPEDQLGESGDFVWTTSRRIDLAGESYAVGGAAFIDPDTGQITVMIAPATVLSGYC